MSLLYFHERFYIFEPPLTCGVSMQRSLYSHCTNRNASSSAEQGGVVVPLNIEQGWKHCRPQSTSNTSASVLGAGAKHKHDSLTCTLSRSSLVLRISCFTCVTRNENNFRSDIQQKVVVTQVDRFYALMPGK